MYHLLECVCQCLFQGWEVAKGLTSHTTLLSRLWRALGRDHLMQFSAHTVNKGSWPPGLRISAPAHILKPRPTCFSPRPKSFAPGLSLDNDFTTWFLQPRLRRKFGRKTTFPISTYITDVSQRQNHAGSCWIKHQRIRQYFSRTRAVHSSNVSVCHLRFARTKNSSILSVVILCCKMSRPSICMGMGMLTS